MKKIYVREIRHIVANHALTGKATGYRMNSKSVVTKVIREMLRNNWIECENKEGNFFFVSPSKRLDAVFCPLVTEGSLRMLPVPAIKMSVTFPEPDLFGTSKVMAVA